MRELCSPEEFANNSTRQLIDFERVSILRLSIPRLSIERVRWKRRVPMNALDQKLLQFLMTFAGIGCIVVSVWNIPQRVESQRLEEVRASLQREVHQTRRSREETERSRATLHRDPHYREVILQKLEGGLAPADRVVGEGSVAAHARDRTASSAGNARVDIDAP